MALIFNKTGSSVFSASRPARPAPRSGAVAGGSRTVTLGALRNVRVPVGGPKVAGPSRWRMPMRWFLFGGFVLLIGL